MERDISLMSYKANYQFVLQNPIKDLQTVTEKLYEKYQKKGYTVHETAVLKVLAIYEYLNKYNMERIISKYVPEAIRKADYGKILRQLVQEGVIHRLYLDKGSENINVYCLSTAAIVLLKKTGLVPVKRSLYEEKDTRYILSKLSLNQFTISILLNYPVSRWEFEKKLQLTTLQHSVECYMRIDGVMRLVELYVSTFPKGNNYGKFLENILLINDYINQKSLEQRIKGSRFCVVLCESIIQIKEAYKIMMSYEDTKHLQVLFSIDGFAIKRNTLNWLYLCENDEGNNCILRNISLDVIL